MRNFILLFLVLFASTAAFAINISSIEVIGNQRVETATVKAFLGISEGDKISRDELDKAFRRTYETGLFKDLNIKTSGNKLIIEVEENPVVSIVEVDGNDKLSDEKIIAELKITPRAVFKESDLQSDTTRILTLYQRSGRFNVNVKPVVEELKNNRVKVVYVINEGERSEVSQITFINNSAFDEAALESEISTKESRWWSFFSGNDNYDPDRVEYDKELLRRHYTQHGYADFRVVSASAEFSPISKSFNVIFNLDEGIKYNFGEIEIDNKIKDFDSSVLEEVIRTEKGEVYNSRRIDDSISTLTDKLGDKGYAFVKIIPNVDKDKEKKLANITYKISEGPRVYVNKININGNSRTMDEVIRREFRLAEGDPYNASKIKRSKQRVEGLGFFSKVGVKNQPTPEPDRVNLDVDVQEQSTGELTFGTGFSTQDGILGDVSIVERNLLGKGQFMRVNLTAATARREAELSFTEPYFLDRTFNAGFDVFHTVLTGDNFSNNLTFDSASTGFTLRGGYMLNEYLTHNVRYTLRSDDISNAQAGSSQFVLQQLGERLASTVGHSFAYNTLDNQFFPTDGLIASIAQDYAGLGGDVSFLRHEAKVSYFTKLDNDEFEEWIFRVTAKGGNVTGMNGKDVQINDRFFIGGNVVRGFENQGLGARDATTLDPLGGNNYYAGTTELMFPLGLPNELQMKGAVFGDVGSLFGTDDTGTGTILDEASPRASLGVGVFWRSPVGPIRIDLAKPVVSESYDREEVIRFNFGTRF